MNKIDALMQKITLNPNNEDNLIALWHMVEKPVFYTAYRILHTARHSNDVAADTFVAIWRNASKLKYHKNCIKWILTIARNKAIDVKKMLDHYQFVDLENEKVVADLGLYYMQDMERNIVLHDTVKRIIQSLSANDKKVLFWINRGYRRKAIAKRTGFNIRKVRYRTDVMRMYFRDKLKEDK